MIENKYPYSSDWRVIRGRLLGDDYKQISGFKGCWSDRDEWLERKVKYETQNGL